MTKRSKDERDAVGTLGAYAIGGAGLASARLLGGLLSEGRSSLHDLGPAPIGSDPWLLREVRAALDGDPRLGSKDVTVHVKEAVVVLRGAVVASLIPRIEAAARTVQGIKTLRLELTSR